MKVYVVTYYYEDIEVIGVFESKQKAEEYINDCVKQTLSKGLKDGRFRYNIKEKILNAGD